MVRQVWKKSEFVTRGPSKLPNNRKTVAHIINPRWFSMTPSLVSSASSVPGACMFEAGTPVSFWLLFSFYYSIGSFWLGLFCLLVKESYSSRYQSGFNFLNLSDQITVTAKYKTHKEFTKGLQRGVTGSHICLADRHCWISQRKVNIRLYKKNWSQPVPCCSLRKVISKRWGMNIWNERQNLR
jgi:hypothetical protein